VWTAWTTCLIDFWHTHAGIFRAPGRINDPWLRLLISWSRHISSSGKLVPFAGPTLRACCGWARWLCKPFAYSTHQPRRTSLSIAMRSSRSSGTRTSTSSGRSRCVRLSRGRLTQRRLGYWCRHAKIGTTLIFRPLAGKLAHR
jgi:hypothetical protein